MTWLATLLGNEKLARRVVLIGGGTVLLIILLAVGKCGYDRHVIAAHNAKQQAELATKARTADEKAAASRVTTTQIIANDSQEITNALAPLPDAPLTDRQRARLCAVWLQQHRGAAKPAGC